MAENFLASLSDPGGCPNFASRTYLVQIEESGEREVYWYSDGFNYLDFSSVQSKFERVLFYQYPFLIRENYTLPQMIVCLNSVSPPSLEACPFERYNMPLSVRRPLGDQPPTLCHDASLTVKVSSQSNDHSGSSQNQLLGSLEMSIYHNLRVRWSCLHAFRVFVIHSPFIRHSFAIHSPSLFVIVAY